MSISANVVGWSEDVMGAGVAARDAGTETWYCCKNELEVSLCYSLGAATFSIMHIILPSINSSPSRSVISKARMMSSSDPSNFLL
jgi:hypothetical protein